MCCFIAFLLSAGGFLRRGISGGERKRVSIGHELLINPAILMLVRNSLRCLVGVQSAHLEFQAISQLVSVLALLTLLG